MAQIPQRNLLNIKLGSANGIKVNQTRKIDFLSYNDLYNYAINGAAKEFEAKYSDVTFKAGSQEAINVAGLHKEDFMSTTKEALLEELHTELLKTKRVKVQNTPLNIKLKPTKGITSSNLGTIEHTNNYTILKGHTIRNPQPLADEIIASKFNPQILNRKTVTLDNEKANDVSFWINQFTKGNLTVAQLKVYLKDYDIKYTEQQDGNYHVITFSYKLDGNTKNFTIKCNKVAAESGNDSIETGTYTAKDLNEQGFIEAKLINKYFDIVEEENGVAKKYAVKSEYGNFLGDLKSMFIENSIFEQLLTKISDYEKPTTIKRINFNDIKEQYFNIWNNIERGYNNENLQHYANIEFTEKEKDAIVIKLLKNFIDGFKVDAFNGNELDNILKILSKIKGISILKFNDGKFSVSYKQTQYDFVYSTATENEFTSVRTDEGSTIKSTPTIIKSTTGLTSTINTSRNNIVDTCDRFSMGGLEQVLTYYNKKPLKEYLKDFVKYKMNRQGVSDEALEHFSEKLINFTNLYNTNNLSIKVLKEMLEQYLDTLDNISMGSANSEMLLKTYDAKSFLGDFASANYTTTPIKELKDANFKIENPIVKEIETVMNDLISNIKQEFKRATGKDCKYTNEEIEKFIKLELQSASVNGIEVSAYDIISSTVSTYKLIDDLSAKLYSSEAIEHLSNREINKYFTPVVTIYGVVKQYIIKEGVSATEVENLINNKPVGNNIKLKRMIASNSTDEIVQFIKDLLNNKIPVITGLKGDENIDPFSMQEDISVSYSNQVIESFVNNILMKYCEAFDTNEISVNMIFEGLKSYLASMQKMDMKTDTEGLVKEYKADEFLTAFAKENYGNTNADNVMSQLLLNVKKVYTATTGNNCKYSDDQIKKLINTMLQSNSNSNISAYTIIDSAVSMLQQIDSTNNITSIEQTMADMEPSIQTAYELIAESADYITKQLKSGKTINIEDFQNSIISKFGDKYLETDIQSMLAVTLTSILTESGINEDDVAKKIATLMLEGKLELSDIDKTKMLDYINDDSINKPKMAAKAGKNGSKTNSYWDKFNEAGYAAGRIVMNAGRAFRNISNNETTAGQVWEKITTLATTMGGKRAAKIMNRVAAVSSIVDTMCKYAESSLRGENPDPGKAWMDVLIALGGYYAGEKMPSMQMNSKSLTNLLAAYGFNQLSTEIVNALKNKLAELMGSNSRIKKPLSITGIKGDVPQGTKPSRPNGGSGNWNTGNSSIPYYGDKKVNYTEYINAEKKNWNPKTSNDEPSGRKYWKNSDGTSCYAEWLDTDGDGKADHWYYTVADSNGNAIIRSDYEDTDGDGKPDAKIFIYYDEKGKEHQINSEKPKNSNENSYDKDGYDANGYDENGYDKDGYDVNGYDENSYDIYGYDKDGYDKDGNNIDGSYDYNHNTNLTDAQKNVVGNYLRGGYTNPDGSFDSRSFYNDMANVGWGAYVATFKGDSAQDAFRDLQNGASVEDIFKKYGSGIHGSSTSGASGAGDSSGSSGGFGGCGSGGGGGGGGGFADEIAFLEILNDLYGGLSLSDQLRYAWLTGGKAGDVIYNDIRNSIRSVMEASYNASKHKF